MTRVPTRSTMEDIVADLRSRVDALERREKAGNFFNGSLLFWDEDRINDLGTILRWDVGDDRLESTKGLRYEGDLQPRRNSTDYNGYIFVPITDATSANWDGDAKAANTTYNVNTSSEFGLPNGIHAVYLTLRVRFGGGGGTIYVKEQGYAPLIGGVEIINPPVSTIVSTQGIVNCDTNGDFEVNVGSVATNFTLIRVWGYWM